MSLFGALGSLSKLKPLLSGQNLEYLDVILTALTDSKSKIYGAFWSDFKSRYGAQADDAHNQAWAGLRKLHEVVREQKGNF